MAIVLSSLFVPVFAQESNSLGVRFIPNKLVVDSEGTILVYALKNDHFFPAQIKDLTVTTLDSKMIEIKETKTDGFITIIKIKALEEGDTEISITAPGYLTQKFPITVYGSKNNQAQLLIKATPSNFNLNGPNNGYISVQLADADGNPTSAANNISVKLSLSKNNIVNLASHELAIKKGEYFAMQEFEVAKSGSVILYATADNMDTVSSTINISEGSESPTVELYVYPQTISSYTSSYAYAIVQLQDAAGNPIKATENINLSVKIQDNALAGVENTSGEYASVTLSSPLEIKKGSYWGYSKLVTRHGLQGTYDISISTHNYDVGVSQQLQSIDLELLDDKFLKLDTLPILATGQEELIGVLRLEDPNGNPVGAKKTLPIQIDSSDNDSLLITPTKIDYGTNSALLFGKTGYLQPDSLTLKLPSEIDETVSPLLIGPTKGSSSLIAEPLIEKAIHNTEFPIMVYLAGDNGGTSEIMHFPEDSQIFVSPSEYFRVDNQQVQKGQPFALLNAKSLKEGIDTLSFESGDYSTTLDMEGMQPKPATILLDYPNPLVPNFNNLFVIQVLDSEGKPLYATHDMDFKLVTNDATISEVPEKVTLKKGEYLTSFNAEPKKTGKTEIAVLASDMPTTQSEINVEELVPQVVISAPDAVKKDSTFEVLLTAQHFGSPISQMNVDWDVNGAQIESMDVLTDQNGQARLILASASWQINIEAKTNGQGFQPAATTKTVEIISESIISEKLASKPLDINGIDPVLILIPSAVIASGIILKKKKLIKINHD